MAHTNASDPAPRLPFLAPQSSRPGVALFEADFASRGEGIIPFKGGRFTVEPGSTSRPDTHQVRECWMVAAGEGLLTYDGGQFRIRAGDYLYFEPMKTHQVHNDGRDTLVIHTVWWG